MGRKERARAMTESQSATHNVLEIRRGYEPGLVGRVGELHGRYYAAAWGVAAPFEIMMTREFCDFIEHYDPERDTVLSPHVGGVLIGSISIVGGKPGTEDAQLRFFLVDPKYQGHGAGKALLKPRWNGARSADSARYSSGPWITCPSRASFMKRPASGSPCDARTIATRFRWRA